MTHTRLDLQDASFRLIIVMKWSRKKEFRKLRYTPVPGSLTFTFSLALALLSASPRRATAHGGESFAYAAEPNAIGPQGAPAALDAV